MKNIVVVGGGPAGMMAAYAAAKNGARVTLLEQNRILGRKLLITGKGRCNVTNFSSEDELITQVVHNPKFLYSAFSSFNAYDAYAFFEEQGVPLKIERGNRVFPISDRAVDVRDGLVKSLKSVGVRIVFDKIVKIEVSPFKLVGEQGNYTCDRLILATGGCSYPLTGSTGDGYRFAAAAGHRVLEAAPALVALVENGNTCCKMAGLSLKNVNLTLFSCKGKKLYSDFGEMLFTHQGISGPLVLSASSYATKNDFPCTAEVDLKPALTEEMLDKRLVRDFEEFVNRDFRNALEKLLPKKMIPVVIEQSEIPATLKVHQITREQRLRLLRVIKHFKVQISGKAGFEEAIITAGGVDVSQVDPRTMESKLCAGLYFAGELLNVDALTGGYNLQIAYSTGYLAGVSAATEG
ncbi:MAG: NAD(P)/FAD-dependent oxidoreductase [Clostridia bacterium]|nr:NAD(P)/FAD-dependent oxidoreductase [Clostridia bacterium]